MKPAFKGHREPQHAAPKASHLPLGDFTAGVIQSIYVAFEVPFTVVPEVTATAHVDVPSSADVTVDEVTEGGFMLHAERPGGGPGFVVSWQATEPTQ